MRTAVTLLTPPRYPRHRLSLTSVTSTAATTSTRRQARTFELVCDVEGIIGFDYAFGGG